MLGRFYCNSEIDEAFSELPGVSAVWETEITIQMIIKSLLYKIGYLSLIFVNESTGTMKQLPPLPLLGEPEVEVEENQGV